MRQINMNKRLESIVLAEQRVAEAQAAVLAEYQAAQAKLNRRIGSSAVIGGVLLGAVALGYLALGRGKPKRPGGAGAWSCVVKTVQVLLPLLVALKSVTKPVRRLGAGGGGGTAG